MASPPLVVVLTGGSGVGKTTLIDRLASLGFSTVPEAAMQVIDSLNTLLDPEQQLAWRSTHKTAFGNLVGPVALQQEQRALRSPATSAAHWSTPSIGLLVPLSANPAARTSLNSGTSGRCEWQGRVQPTGP